MSILTKCCLILVILAGSFEIYQGLHTIPLQITKLKENTAQVEDAKKSAEKERDVLKLALGARTADLDQQKELARVDRSDSAQRALADNKKIDDAVAAASSATEAKRESEGALSQALKQNKELEKNLGSVKTKLEALERVVQAFNLPDGTAKVAPTTESLEVAQPLVNLDYQNLEGEVAAIDQKWDFVVMNIGASDGVKKDDEMTVSRAGKLIGRIKITRVDSAISIGTPMKLWKLDQIKLGDRVTTGYRIPTNRYDVYSKRIKNNP